MIVSMRLIYAYVVSVLVIGCADRETRVLTTIEQSLLRSGELIRLENAKAVDVLGKRWGTAITGGPAVDWAPKAKALQLASKALNEQLDNIKGNIDRMKGGDSAVATFLRRQETSIAGLINGYRFQVRRIIFDSTTDVEALREQQNLQRARDADSAVFSFVGLPGRIKVNWEKGIESEFKDVLGNDRMAAALAIGRIKLALSLMENSLVGLCNDNAKRYLYCGYQYSYIAQLDRGEYSAGDTITVHVGKSEIATYKSPKVWVADSTLKIESDGAANYSWIAKGKPGVYSLPIVYEYEKPNGGKLSWTKNIKYVIEK